MTPERVIDVAIADDRWTDLDLDALCARAADVALDMAEIGGAVEISILAADDAEMARLNGSFRGKDAPTNVLSWPSEERGAAAPGGVPEAPRIEEIGDIALGYETCAREAVENGVSLHDHVTHLVIHGVLHLLGYDHERDEDATVMESLEIAALERLGIANPY